MIPTLRPDTSSGRSSKLARVTAALGSTTTAPAILNFVNYTTSGEPTYRLSTQKLVDGTTILARDSYQRNSSVFDVWTAQLGVRYTFGK
jgi:hypothetical protein